MDLKNLITCPYNKAHQIRPGRIQYHLVKCRKNHPGKELKICPFNANHRFEEHEIQGHVRTCPQRTVVDLRRHGFYDPNVGGSEYAPVARKKTESRHLLHQRVDSTHMSSEGDLLSFGAKNESDTEYEEFAEAISGQFMRSSEVQPQKSHEDWSGSSQGFYSLTSRDLKKKNKQGKPISN